jgi:hypothetical protein
LKSAESRASRNRPDADDAEHLVTQPDRAGVEWILRTKRGDACMEPQLRRIV